MTRSQNPVTSMFALRGRLARKPYWMFVAGIAVIRIVAAIAWAYNDDWDFAKRLDFLMVVLALLIGRRMRDFGLAAYWGWIGVAAISFVIPITALLYWPQPHDPGDTFGAFDPLFAAMLTIALVLLVVFVGLKKGDPGTNRYGPAPIDVPSATTTSS